MCVKNGSIANAMRSAKTIFLKKPRPRRSTASSVAELQPDTELHSDAELQPEFELQPDAQARVLCTTHDPCLRVGLQFSVRCKSVKKSDARNIGPATSCGK